MERGKRIITKVRPLNTQEKRDYLLSNQMISLNQSSNTSLVNKVFNLNQPQVFFKTKENELGVKKIANKHQAES